MASPEMNALMPFAQVVFGLPAALSALRFPLPLTDAEDARAIVRELRHQLSDYLLPRLSALDAPLLAVVGGSTGAGKSTLVNTLLGEVVTTPGVLRPTTKAPVLIHHPANEMWFNSDRILPGLVRSHAATADIRSLQLVSTEALPVGLALVDAPDIDSIDGDNRALARTLLAAADLWIFVTSAARYADAVPWAYLQDAAGRGASVAVVCDRIPAAAMTEVPRHLRQLMDERGLRDSLLFSVPESSLSADGLLPAPAVAPIRSWLHELARESSARQAVIRQTLLGAVRALEPKLRRLAAASDEQLACVVQLETDAASSFTQAARNVSAHAGDGTLLRGEVLARWQDFVGTGAFMRAVERRISFVRDRIVGPLRAYSPEADDVRGALSEGLAALLREECEAACERAELAWRSTPAGRHALVGTSGLGSPSEEFGTNAVAAIRAWQSDVLDMVAEEGCGRQTKARFLALGVNGIAAALMVLVFASTGGLTGAEVGIAGGASVLAQRLLESIFGDAAVRSLSAKAQRLLESRVEALFASELERFQEALARIDVPVDGGDPLRRLLTRLSVSLAGGDLPFPSS